MSFFHAVLEQLGSTNRWNTQWPTVLFALLIPVCLMAVADKRMRPRR
jgi:hypothetical protein